MLEPIGLESADPAQPVRTVCLRFQRAHAAPAPGQRSLRDHARRGVVDARRSFRLLAPMAGEAGWICPGARGVARDERARRDGCRGVLRLAWPSSARASAGALRTRCSRHSRRCGRSECGELTSRPSGSGPARRRPIGISRWPSARSPLTASSGTCCAWGRGSGRAGDMREAPRWCLVRLAHAAGEPPPLLEVGVFQATFGPSAGGRVGLGSSTRSLRCRVVLQELANVLLQTAAHTPGGRGSAGYCSCWRCS